MEGPIEPMWKQLCLISLALVSAACASPQAPHSGTRAPLRVAAAAISSLFLPPILSEFERATGIHAEVTFQSSATLATQIQNGAPFDVFLSADLSFPKRLIDAGLADAAGSADSTTPIAYARGTLVLWERKDSQPPPPSLDLLRSPNLKRLAIANPDRAPYGRAAVAALNSLDLYDTLSRKSSLPKMSRRPRSLLTPPTPMPASSRSHQRSRRASPRTVLTSSFHAISTHPSSRALSSSATQAARRRSQAARLSPLTRRAGRTRQVRPHAGEVAAMDLQAFALSLRLAAVTTAILLAIAIPLAALIVLGRSRWLAAVEALATLPMVLRLLFSVFSFLFCLGRELHSAVAFLHCSATRWHFLSTASLSAPSSTVFPSLCSLSSPASPPSTHHSSTPLGFSAQVQSALSRAFSFRSRAARSSLL